MATRPSENPMRIRLSEERRGDLLDSFGKFYRGEFDEELSDYRAQKILTFFVRSLGPPIYNQAISDARAFMFEKLEDLDAEFYEPDIEA